MLRRSFLLHSPLTIIGMGSGLAACASGPGYREVAARIPSVPDGQSRVWFYRDSSPLGAAIQPAVFLDGVRVGSSIPGGFFFRDTPPGRHEVTVSTEVDRKVTFTTEAGQEQFVRMRIGIGFIAGRVEPELESPVAGRSAVQGLSFTGEL